MGETSEEQTLLLTEEFNLPDIYWKGSVEQQQYRILESIRDNFLK